MKRICLAFVLSALGSAALAAGTQPVTISSTTPTDLGAAPVFVQTLNQPVNICVADNSPTVGTQCNILQPGPPVTFYPADAGSHVWASILGSSSLIAYTPVYSSGSSIGSVTQGTVPWVDDVQQWADTVLGAPSNFGTSPGAVKVPGVNAYVTDFPSTYAVTGTFWQATQPVSIASGQVVANAFAVGSGTDGWFTTFGLKADTASATAGGTAMSVWRQIDADINTLNTTAGSALAAGTNLIGKVGIDQTTPGTTNGVALVSVNGATALAGAGATGTGSPRVTAAQDQTTIAGATPGRTYNTVAASQSTQALTGGSGGATGDYLSHCDIIPATTAAGAVTIFDNSTAVFSYAGGGTTALLSLIPFPIPVGAVSVSGAWKVTTGANVSVVCVGKFT